MKRLLLCLACISGASCAAPSPMRPGMPLDRDLNPQKAEPAIASSTA